MTDIRQCLCALIVLKCFGKGDVVSGLKNKLSTMAIAVTPSGMPAEEHRRMVEPGSATK
jgi:hypothetical protein